VFGVIEILDLNVGPGTALMIRVFCFARSFQANGEWFVTYAESASFFISSVVVKPGRDSSVGIVTRYGLDGPGIKSRWGARFSASDQIVPGAHVASCRMSTSFFLRDRKAGARR
jgi:hypothetical protein